MLTAKRRRRRWDERGELGLAARALLRPGQPFGPLLESFVLSEIARQLTWSDERVELFHYRDRDRFEVDAVLENRAGDVVGVEVKAASTVGPDDFRGLRRLAERLGDDFIAGIVLYTGTSTLPFGPKLRAVPLSALWQVYLRDSPPGREWTPQGSVRDGR